MITTKNPQVAEILGFVKQGDLWVKPEIAEKLDENTEKKELKKEPKTTKKTKKTTKKGK